MIRTKTFQWLALPVLVCFINFNIVHAQSKTFTVTDFNEVIVSPHISATFKKGDKESITVENITIAMDKFKTEMEGKTLRVYLEGAKVITKSEKYENENWKGNRSIYNGTIAKVVITYKDLTKLSLRGEETFTSEGLLKADQFTLNVYGASQIYFDEVDIDRLKSAIYGESYIKIKKGTVNEQKFTAYGESKINTLDVANKATKITCYGEGSFQLNVEEDLKVTAYGEATVAYKGDPDVRKGIVLGEATIEKIR